MKKKMVYLFGLFVFFVLWLVPASLLRSYLPPVSGLIVGNIQGTIWGGEIDTLQYRQLQLKAINFSLKPFELITGAAAVAVELNDGDVTGSVDIAAESKASFTVRSADLMMRAYLLEAFLPIRGIKLEGRLASQDLDFAINDTRPTFIEGVTSWQNASVDFSGQLWQLGDFAIRWRTLDDGRLQGIFQKTDNRLGLEGKIELSSQGMLEFIGSISDKTEKPVYDTLALFADGKAASGRLPLKFKQKIF